jgi:hypothetical protein
VVTTNDLRFDDRVAVITGAGDLPTRWVSCSERSCPADTVVVPGVERIPD